MAHAIPHRHTVGRARAADSGVLGDAGRSLRLACGVWIAIWLQGLFWNHVVAPILSPDRPLDDAWPWPASPVAALCILVSLAIILWTRRARLSPDRLLDLALVYEVFLAFAIGVVNQWTPNTAGLSWICVLILVHPLIVPAPPGRALAAALLAASMDPVGLAISGARGSELPPGSVILWTYLPNYICAFLAVLPARIRVRMEQHRADARELGSYHLGELLGRGGMGEIYRAEHRMLHRPAAVKLVRPELLGASSAARRESIARRFEREANVTASLCSPHTVHVYDYGITEDGTFYYVMELLEGLDLETLVRDHGSLPVERVVPILRQVCESLGEAHEKGLTHRDVKPSNVYVCRYARRVDFVKVLDFGLARSAETPRSDVTVTAEAAVVGTPAFMAPEQILGTHAVGPATDLYAVGCLAYWLLTGTLVFEGATPMEVLTKHAKDAPAPPSRASELPLPPEMDELVLACLAKDPAGRPSSADDLSRRLAVVPLAGDWSEETARQWWDTHHPRNPA